MPTKARHYFNFIMHLKENAPMSEKELSALINKLKGDADLRENLQSGEGIDAAEASAKKAGFDLSDLMNYGMPSEHKEVSESELEMVAGGRWVNGCGGWSGGGSNPCIWVY